MKDTYPSVKDNGACKGRPNPHNTTIVVSRWNGDTSWTVRLVELGYRVCVYDHGTNPNNPYSVPENVGREASVYMKYMRDYYDNLTTYTVFVHEHELSWHHDGSLVDMIVNKLAGLCSPKYVNFNNRCTGSIENGWWEDKSIQRFFDKYLAAYIGKLAEYGNWTLGNRCCAQFIVHKSRITKHPRAFYEKLYKFTLEKTEDPAKNGHLLEWTYNLIFDSPVLYPKGKPSKAEREKALEKGGPCPQSKNRINSRPSNNNNK